MIEDKLRLLGLTDNEIAIYLVLLESGKLSVPQITGVTSINRTTIYSVLKELIKKNLVIEDITGSTRYYLPENTERLREAYKKDEEEVNQKKRAVETLIKELEVLPKSKNYSVPKVRFIEESQMNDFLHKNLLKWVESGKDKDANWWGIQDASLLVEYPAWVEYHWQVLPKFAGMKMFINNMPAEKIAKQKNIPGRDVKFWKGKEPFTATYAVMGDYVLFIMTHQHPHYLVETHDVVLAENMRNMYKTIWQMVN